MQKRNSILFLNLILVVLYLAIGITAVTLAIIEYEATKITLGLFILSGMMPHFVGFAINIKSKLNSSIFVFLLVASLVIGFTAIFAKNISIETVCLMFGILDICRGIAEIFVDIRERFLPIKVLEILISLGDIAFGILLIFERVSGIHAHIFYLGFALILMAIIRLVRTIKNVK